jgi:hypothetical protein
MTDSQNESVLNGPLIDMARGFLQYVSESWPWVEDTRQAIGHEVEVLAARQRQDVGDIAAELNRREWAIDFGAFPTEYTDLHFISLSAMLKWLLHSQTVICDNLASAETKLRQNGDAAGASLLAAVTVRQQDITKGLQDIQKQLQEEPSPTA